MHLEDARTEQANLLTCAILLNSNYDSFSPILWICRFVAKKQIIKTGLWMTSQNIRVTKGRNPVTHS